MVFLRKIAFLGHLFLYKYKNRFKKFSCAFLCVTEATFNFLREFFLGYIKFSKKKKVKFTGISNDFLKTNNITVHLPHKTRWIYHLKLVQSIIDNKNKIKQACDIVKKDFLTLKEFELVEKFIEAALLINGLITKFLEQDSKD